MNFEYPRQRALESPKTFATVVHAIVIDKYGEQAYKWDPSTIYLELRDDFNADTCPEVMDRWSAIQVIMTTDAFFRRVDAFMGICNTLAEGEPFFSVFNPVSLEEIAWTVTEVSLNRELLPFSYAVKKYIRTILSQSGYGENDYPYVFEEVFAKKPSSDSVREGIGVHANNANIDAMIREQIEDMEYQFNSIPDLKRLDDSILDVGFEEAMEDHESAT